MAARAYQQWLLNKKKEQQQRMKEEKIGRELLALHEEQRKFEQEKAKTSFTTWKQNKDMERRLKFESSSTEVARDYPAVQQAPLLPGYCSVWACDEKLADHMLARVHRQAD